MGEGSTINMLGIWQQTEDMLAKRAELTITRERLVTELEQLTGVSDDETWVD
jgi:predicted RNA-binding protein with PIN domain